MRTSEVLNRAADLIQEHGWGQGPETWEPGNGAGLCIEGGIIAALGLRLEERPWAFGKRCPAYTAVYDYLGLSSELWSWNDDHGRTEAEVIEVLRATALIEQARENAEIREALPAC